MLEINNAVESPPQHQSKKSYLRSIVAKSPPGGQCCSFKGLTRAIQGRELTKSLEILETCGITGDTAVFAIGCIQVQGGEA